MHQLTACEVHTPWASHFSYPYRGWYSVLRALDHFREAPQLDEIEVGEEMKALERRIDADPEAAKHMAALKSGFSVELDLEREGRANETTMGELELFIVNPDGTLIPCADDEAGEMLGMILAPPLVAAITKSIAVVRERRLTAEDVPSEVASAAAST